MQIDDQFNDCFERFIKLIDPRLGSGCYIVANIPELVLVNIIDWMIECKNKEVAS